MSDYQTRVTMEKQALDEKIGKLSIALGYINIVDNIDVIPISYDHEQVALMKEQFIAMRHYSDILGKQISLLNQTEEAS